MDKLESLNYFHLVLVKNLQFQSKCDLVICFQSRTLACQTATETHDVWILWGYLIKMNTLQLISQSESTILCSCGTKANKERKKSGNLTKTYSFSSAVNLQLTWHTLCMLVCVCVFVYLLHACDGHSSLHASVLPLFGQLVVNLPGAEDQPLHLLWTLRCQASFWDQPLEVSSYAEKKKKKSEGESLFYKYYYWW